MTWLEKDRGQKRTNGTQPDFLTCVFGTKHGTASSWIFLSRAKRIIVGVSDLSFSSLAGSDSAIVVPRFQRARKTSPSGDSEGTRVASDDRGMVTTHESNSHIFGGPSSSSRFAQSRWMQDACESQVKFRLLFQTCCFGRGHPR